MKKGVLVLVFALIFSVLILNLASAKIVITEPKEIYNLGDKLYVSVTATPVSISGNFKIDLVCNNQSVNLVKTPARAFPLGEEHTYSLPYVELSKEELELKDIKVLVGLCNLVVSLSDEQISSKNFRISDFVSVKVDLNKQNYDPGETIALSISAIKENGYKLDGFVKASGVTQFDKAIIGGNASETFAMPKTTEAGEYKINLSVFENGKDGEQLNTGQAEVSFNINQVPTFILTTLQSSEVGPGNESSFTLELFDQSGKKMDGSISVLVISPIESETQMSITSGGIGTLKFPVNATPGKWKIISTFQGVSDEQEISVKSVPRIEFEFLDKSILLVKNVGNDVYNKTIDVNIGDNETQQITLNLQVGEERKFKLRAPSGEYDVSVNDGTSFAQKTLLLTGEAAFSISDPSNIDFLGEVSPLVFLIIGIIVLSFIIVFLILKFRKREKYDSGPASFASPSKPSPKSSNQSVSRQTSSFASKQTSNLASRQSSSLPFSPYTPSAIPIKTASIQNRGDEKIQKVKDLSFLENNARPSYGKKDMVDMSKPTWVSSAESSFVMKGKQEKSSVISLKVSNYYELNTLAKQELNRIISISKDKKGVVDSRENYTMIIFTPEITRNANNEPVAASVAFDMLKEFKEYNRKSVNKIIFNLGVHSGDLLIAFEGNKLKYTGMGNTILLAKKMADLDRDKLLVSEAIKGKLMRNLKSEKVSMIGNNAVYSVNNVLDERENQARLADLLKRNNF
ncbi:MAG: hypothetical protein Q7S33_00420 [Nanoarchaeota archaeon]|nr:hypothetical protein [Nanoarchaeota archaeon]